MPLNGGDQNSRTSAMQESSRQKNLHYHTLCDMINLSYFWACKIERTPYRLKSDIIKKNEYPT